MDDCRKGMTVSAYFPNRLAALLATIVLALMLASCKSSDTADTDAGGADAVAASVLTVTVTEPQQQDWPDTVQASGPVSAWQEIVVSPETGGLRIAALTVEVGDSVRRGQTLARLADDTVEADLRKQQAVVAQAQAALNQASSNVRRARSIESSGALSAQQIEDYRIVETTAKANLQGAQADLENARIRLSQTRIAAPDDGVVSSRAGVLGSVVAAGAEVYRLVRQGRLEWRPEFDARQLGQIAQGQVATLTLPTGEKVEGKVRIIEPTLSASTGRASAYVDLPAGSGARAGMFASGRIDLKQRAALTLPQSAVVMRDGRSYVYIVGDDNKVSSRLVTTGRRRGDRVEVVSGVDRTTTLVASGGSFLSEGATITISESPPGSGT